MTQDTGVAKREPNRQMNYVRLQKSLGVRVSELFNEV